MEPTAQQQAEIARLVETGYEDVAREQFGDAAVDAWFVADGWDVEAARAEA